MNEEIKEILESLDKIAKSEYYPEDLLYYENCKILLDYITNLQNRIIELEEINKQHQEINSELRTKIGKAVEYIKENATSNYFDGKINMFRREVDLLNILQDKEEV